ncbi:MAG: hypothetical protein KDA95_11275 [Acidimicrobiales bacterium]|nr:hypothetical protein [Acidimicrobiales bacterium]
MDLSKLTLSDKIIGGTAIAMVINLLFLPWHKVSMFGISETRSGVQSPNSFWGLLALLLALALIAVIIVRKVTDVELPEVPLPWGQLTFFATIAVGALVLIKLISETDFLGFGAYLAVLLGGGMIYGGFLGKDDADSSTSLGSGSGAPPTPF